MRTNTLSRRLASLEAVQKALSGPDVICLTGRDVELTDASKREADAARVPGRVVLMGVADEA